VAIPGERAKGGREPGALCTAVPRRLRPCHVFGRGSDNVWAVGGV
jgi:hypothetical protein